MQINHKHPFLLPLLLSLQLLISINAEALQMRDSQGNPETSESVIITDSIGHVTTPGHLQFITDHYQVTEKEGRVDLTITRTGGSDGVVEVTYSTEDGTAKGQDYIADQGTLRWLDGESGDKDIKVDIHDDTLVELNEDFFITLLNPTGGAKLGENAKAKVTIMNDDVPTTIQFSSDTYVVNENEKFATITVKRKGGRMGQVSVDYETIDITATAPEDYAATEGPLVWVSGDTSDKKFTIPLHDDNLVEGHEILQLKLSNITENAIFGTPIEASLTLIENDTAECESSVIIDCFWDNTGNTLRYIKITPLGTVKGGELAGHIENEGIVQNVTLLANTDITGGIVRGNIKGDKGDSNNPPILRNVEITTDSTLTELIIGRGSFINSGVILKKGVLFESNSSIPYMADLKTILGHISAPYLEIEAINLTNDILLNSGRNGIVGAFNGLVKLITGTAITLRQNPDNGYIALDVAPIHYRMLPVQVRQVWGKQTIGLEPMGIKADNNGQVTIITHTGRKVTMLPVVQNPQALRKALNILNLNKMTMQPNGNLKVPTDKEGYYMARPDSLSKEVPKETPLGIKNRKSPWLSNLTEIVFVFEESTNKREQLMYPAAADPEAFYAVSGIDNIYLDGRVNVLTGEGITRKQYKGQLDYLVTPGTPPPAKKLQVIEIEDINEDGFNDYRITYPNGDKQIMYQCADCFE